MNSPPIGNPASMTRPAEDSADNGDDRVDSTAMGVAIARAWEVSSQRPLFTDPYVQMLVDGSDTPVPLLDGAHARTLTDFAAARTKWFDDFFLASSAAGVSQIVMLSAGLDTRAWRLPWLSDTVIYEVDRPNMLTYKARILQTFAKDLAARYVPVPVTTQDEWPDALREAGFDPAEPTAWSAEGLLPTLSANAQDTLFEQIALYSARGSRIALETSPQITDAAAWLCSHRWDVNATPGADLLHRYHRDPVDDAGEPPVLSLVVEGRLL